MDTINLIKRNLKLYYRDKVTVFFSFLSSMIVVLLYILFIAKIYTDSMDTAIANGMPIDISANGKNFFVYMQMIAGVLVLNSISIATGVFSSIAKDFESKRIDCILLTPTNPFKIIVAYLVSGLVATFIINTITFLLGFIIIGASTSYWLGFGAFVSVIGVTLFVCFVACSVMLLVTVVVKSSTAIGVISGFAGTIVGFLCGIYIPFSTLGDAAKAVGSLLPFSHLTVLLKQIVLNDVSSTLGVGSELKAVLFDEYFSAKSIGFCGIDAPLWLMIIFSAVFAIVCVTIALILFKKRLSK